MSRESRLIAAGPHFYGLREGSVVGGEVYERELLARLPEHGVEVAVGLPRSAWRPDVPPGWDITWLRHGSALHWIVAPLVFVPYTLSLLRGGRVDLLRGHSLRYCGPSLILARRLARARAPIVLHHHHTEPRWEGLEGRLMRQVDAVVTVSEHSRAQVLEAGVRPERIFVVPDGVEGPALTQGQPEAWPREGGLRLLHLGRLIERKRPHVAVEAMSLLLGRGAQASLVVAGDGPLRPTLESLAHERGVADAVRFVGTVSEEEKWQLYDSADLLLFPSPLEGFGLVAVEAQHRGLPVIAAGGTGTAEVVVDGQTGLLVASSAEAFATAVEQLGDRSLRAEMGTRARSAAERFSWDRCACEVAEVYRAIVRGSLER